MRQVIPVSQDGLLGAMNISIKAAIAHGAEVGLVHHTAAGMSAARQAAVVSRNARELGKEELRKLRLMQETERLATREFALLAKDQLKPALGRLYHPGWDVTGFKGGFRVSERAPDLEVWAETFYRYLLDHPDKEVPLQNITAAFAEARYLALKNARAAVKFQEGAVTALIQESETAFAVLLRMLRGLVKELSLKLSPDDGLWITFGFNQPGAKERPEAPENITTAVVSEDEMSVEWEPTPRAKYYRVRQRIVGVDHDFMLIGSPSDPDFMIAQAPAGVQVELAISAVNDGGESAWHVVVVQARSGELQIEK